VTAKLLSPRMVGVCGTANVLCRKMIGDDDRATLSQFGGQTPVESRNHVFLCGRRGTRYQTTCEIRHVLLTVFTGT